MLPLQDYPTGPTAVAGNSLPVVATASSTDEVVLATFAVPALRKNDALRVTAQYTHTNSANNKTVRVKLGSTTLGSKVTTTKAGDKLVVDIANANATNAQIGEDGITAAVETKNGTSVLSITGQKATGSETLTLVNWNVELIQRPVR